MDSDEEKNSSSTSGAKFEGVSENKSEAAVGGLGATVEIPLDDDNHGANEAPGRRDGSGNDQKEEKDHQHQEEETDRGIAVGAEGGEEGEEEHKNGEGVFYPSVNSERSGEFTPFPDRASVSLYALDGVRITIHQPDPARLTVYTIRGKDGEGDFENTRKYKEFTALRTALLKRWPGVYVPPVENRIDTLAYFLNQLGKNSYLYFSEETKIFLRGTPDVEKVLSSMVLASPGELLEKYNNQFSETAGRQNNADLEENLSLYFQKLRGTKDCITKTKAYAEKMALHFRNWYGEQANFLDTIRNFEKTHLESYCGENNSTLVFKNNEYKSRCDEGLINLRNATISNPFDDMADWCHRAMLEIDAYTEAFKGRQLMISQKDKCSSRIRKDSTELHKLQAGKKTLRSVLKKGNANDQMEALEAALENKNSESEAYDAIIDIITLNLAYVELAKYERDVLDTYYALMKNLVEQQATIMKEGHNLWREMQYEE